MIDYSTQDSQLPVQSLRMVLTSLKSLVRDGLLYHTTEEISQWMMDGWSLGTERADLGVSECVSDSIIYDM